MNLQFDSIGELEQFLMFAAHIGRAFATAPAAEHQMDQPTVSENGGSTEPESPPLGDQAGEDTDGAAAATGAPSEPVKRKRRTKAEMEAAARAVADARAADPETTEGNAAQAAPAEIPMPPADYLKQLQTEPESAESNPNPFAQAPAIQAILDAPTHAASLAAAAAAMQKPLDELPVVTSLQHLQECQQFIQKHGMPKYSESFRDGLTANIAAYTDEQRSQHVAILRAMV